MIKYRLYAPNDGDTMTVDGGGGWVSNDDRKGGGANDRNNDKGGSAVNLSKNPENQAIVNPYLAVALPMPVYPIYGTPGFTINTAVIETGLAKISAVIGRALPVAGRLLGVTVGSMWPSSTAPSSLDSIYNQAHQQALAQLAAQQGVLNKGYNVTAMPAGLVSSLPVSEIKSLPTAPASLLAQSVINTELSQRQLTLTQPATNAPVANIPVVKAEKTAVPGVYSAKIIAGEPAFKIKVDNTQTALAKAPPKVKDDVQISSFLSTPVADTHHAFIDFGSDHDPVYVSLSKIVTAEEEKKQVEEAKRREQEWLLRHPVEAAERALFTAQKEYEEAVRSVNKQTARIANAEQNIIDSEIWLDDFLMYNPPHEYGRGWPEQVSRIKKEVAQWKSELSDAQNKLSIALESRQKAEQDKKSADQKLKDEQETKRKGVRDAGHKYHPNPDTSEIKGLGELKEGRAKTPKQGGGGKRARWIGEKGRKIYEWDSQHGELEGYRASDGQHLGAFDPKTGKQLKPADPKRNIKKYL
ncbi:colicin-like bacteriocin tRNase domain-containing protein [Pectobacterium parmentieri]|uniref:colicin-like bacteriocin tRNase domain-containing protein n=1 Tax=Pectobacterium parmentieri TaxID=1905730 RepID=UPI0018DF8BA2|nr:colicin-like bacteriocin tRNase domain-containing protein [Pectobacterium parmentieri]MBI0552603.1 cloacin [Pectobacterium parmentieri]MBI0561626.1 cloacin [Pectobacterium parmentieri]MBI0565912.1 cloacin [Pectobacterium parmentieri]